MTGAFPSLYPRLPPPAAFKFFGMRVNLNLSSQGHSHLRVLEQPGLNCIHVPLATFKHHLSLFLEHRNKIIYFLLNSAHVCHGRHSDWRRHLPSTPAPHELLINIQTKPEISNQQAGISGLVAASILHSMGASGIISAKRTRALVRQKLRYSLLATYVDMSRCHNPRSSRH